MNDSGNYPMSMAQVSFEMLQRLSQQSARCKLGSALTGMAVLTAGFCWGGANTLWGALPLFLLALTDGQYSVQRQRIIKSIRQIEKNSLKMDEFLKLQDSGSGLWQAWGGLMGFLSFGVWPFYVALGLMIGLLGYSPVMPASKIGSPPAQRPIPLSLKPQQTMPFRPNPGLSTIPSRPTLPKAPLNQQSRPGHPFVPGSTVPSGLIPQARPSAPPRLPASISATPGTKSNPIIIPIPASSVKLPNANPTSGNIPQASAAPPQQVSSPSTNPASLPPPAGAPPPASVSSAPSSPSVAPPAPPKSN